MLPQQPGLRLRPHQHRHPRCRHRLLPLLSRHLPRLYELRLFSNAGVHALRAAYMLVMHCAVRMRKCWRSLRVQMRAAARKAC